MNFTSFQESLYEPISSPAFADENTNVAYTTPEGNIVYINTNEEAVNADKTTSNSNNILDFEPPKTASVETLDKKEEPNVALPPKKNIITYFKEMPLGYKIATISIATVAIYGIFRVLNKKKK